MRNKKLIIGIAVGAAVLAGAAVILSKRRAGKKYASDIQDAKDHFRGKLNELQRKAQKEYKNAGADVKDAVNTARQG